jgi:cysteine desulfurase
MSIGRYKHVIYLDYNATAPLSAAARRAWLDAQDLSWGNPSSIHAAGQVARLALDRARSEIAGIFSVKPHEVVLTSGGTEANALAIHAALSANGPGEIAASVIEHSSVLRNAQARTATRLLDVDSCGRLSKETVAHAVSAQTRLLCFQFANNEIGTRQDVAALVAAARAANPDVLILLDCAQGAGKQSIDLRALGVDFASVAGHKFGAPKGSGILYVRNQVACAPQLCGGRQQQDRRSGTEDAAMACALSAALKDRLNNWQATASRQADLFEGCWKKISAALPEARWLAREAERLPDTMSLAHPDIDNEPLVTRLDLAGFAVSKGAACMATRNEPSHVITALGVDRSLARSVVRVSIGRETTAAELDGFAKAYVKEIRGLLALSPNGALQ